MYDQLSLLGSRSPLDEWQPEDLIQHVPENHDVQTTISLEDINETNVMQKFAEVIQKISPTVPRVRHELEWRLVLFARHKSHVKRRRGQDSCVTWRELALSFSWSSEKSLMAYCHRKAKRAYENQWSDEINILAPLAETITKQKDEISEEA